MTAEEIRKVVSWLEAAGLARLEVDGPGFALRIGLAARGAAPAIEVSPASIDPASRGHVVAAPLAGTLRLRHPGASAPLAPLGGDVRAGQVVALVEVGAICVPAIAPVAGVLARLHAVPDAAVDHGTPLLEILEAAPAR